MFAIYGVSWISVPARPETAGAGGSPEGGCAASSPEAGEARRGSGGGLEVGGVVDAEDEHGHVVADFVVAVAEDAAAHAGGYVGGGLAG